MTDENPKFPAASVASAPPDNLNLFQEPKVSNQWFNGQEVHLDGWHFVGCRFDNCIIFVSSPLFTLEKCLIDPSSKIVINPSIVAPVRIFNFRMPNNGHPYFWPTFHPDGTISVGAIQSEN